MAVAEPGRTPVRVLIITLEFLGPVFSGNGQYCRSIVRALKQHGCRVFVVSGRKQDVPMEAQDQIAREHANDKSHGAFDVPLCTWQRLDRHSSWIELARGACSDSCLSRVQQFEPQVCLCVDWTAVPAYLALQQRLPAPLPALYLNFRVFASSFPATSEHTAAPSLPDPAALLTQPHEQAQGQGWRMGRRMMGQVEVQARMDALEAHLSPTALPDDRLFYCLLEGASVRACRGGSVALCRSDALVLLALACGVDFAQPSATHTRSQAEGAQAEGQGHGYAPLWAQGCGAAHAAQSFAASLGAGGSAGSSTGGRLRIIMPPLRQDIRETASALLSQPAEPTLPAPSAGYAVPGHLPGHTFLSSVARLSTEKGVHRLGPLLAAVQEAAPGVLARLKLQPLLVGAGPDKEYVEGVLRGVEAACGGQAINGSIGGHQEGGQVHAQGREEEDGRVPPPLNISTYVGNRELASIYSDSSLNVHPALADAYGMTIVEGASFGVPSVVCVPGIGRAYERLQALAHTHGQQEGTGAGVGAGAPAGLFTYFSDCESPGYMRVDVRTFLPPSSSSSSSSYSGASPGTHDLALHIASQGLQLVPSLPPVGCCDLLCADPATALLSGSAAIVALDLHASPAEQAKQLLPWLQDLQQERVTGSPSGGPFSLSAAGKRAQARALAWGEVDNGRALLHAIQHALQGTD